MANKFFIDPDITQAETLPASFYRDEQVFEKLKETVFLKSWHWIGDENLVKEPQQVHPFILFDKFLTEPLLLTKNKAGRFSPTREQGVHHFHSLLARFVNEG